MSMYKHGISVSELPTSVVPPVVASAGLPVVIGTAPLHKAVSPVQAGKPVLAYSYAEAVQALGYSDDFSSYSLCEFIDSHFRLFAASPAVLLNVLDPEIHYTTVTNQNMALIAGTVTISEDGVLCDTLELALEGAGTALVAGQDYFVTQSKNEVKISCIPDGSINSDTAVLVASYRKLNPEAVSANDIIDAIAAVDEVFPRFRLVPGVLVAPQWSANPAVAAALTAKAESINSMFKAIALLDIPTEGVNAVTNYSNVAAYKNASMPHSAHAVACWPKVTLAGSKYCLSTQMAGVIVRTDALNGDIPFVSPSNKALRTDGASTGSGDAQSTVALGPDVAAYLNSQGIVTALNFIGGWVLWGNRTALYPASSDPVEAFIAVRRMMNWINNSLILTFWQKVDDPMNRNLVESVVDSANIWLNGLVARGAVLGGRCEFRPEENPITSLMDGIIRVHLFVTPPSPAREIEFLVEYDPQYLSTLSGE